MVRRDRLNDVRRKFLVMDNGQPVKTLGNYTLEQAIKSAQEARKDHPGAYLICVVNEKTQVMIDISVIAGKEVKHRQNILAS